MLNKIYGKRLWVGLVVLSVVVLSSSSAFASGGRNGRGRDNSIRWHRGDNIRYRFHGDRWYRRSWFGIEVAVPFLPIGAIVANIPVGHATITIGGVPYYHYNHVYYRPCPSGYIVVPAPQEVVAYPAPKAQVLAQLPAGETLTINVPNSNGSYTPVTLVKTGNGYAVPQGEFYPGNPTVDQLKVLYGK